MVPRRPRSSTLFPYTTLFRSLGDVYAQLASRAYDRALQLDKNNAAAQVKLAMVKDLFISQKGTGSAKPAAAPPPRPAPPKAEPAPPPKPEPAAKAEPPKVVAKAEPPKAEPAKAEPVKAEPKATTDDKARITAAIEAWAKAWSAKDVKGYLAAYAPEFEVPGGETRGAWEKQRTERIEKPKSIDVGVK